MYVCVFECTVAYVFACVCVHIWMVLAQNDKELGRVWHTEHRKSLKVAGNMRENSWDKGPLDSLRKVLIPGHQAAGELRTLSTRTNHSWQVSSLTWNSRLHHHLSLRWQCSGLQGNVNKTQGTARQTPSVLCKHWAHLRVCHQSPSWATTSGNRLHPSRNLPISVPTDLPHTQHLEMVHNYKDWEMQCLQF